MHEYRRFVQEQMDLRRMRPADVERSGGPTKQVLSKILNDSRDSLERMPDRTTIQGLAAAFGVDVEKVLASVAAAMGLPTTVNVVDLEAASNQELLDEIRRRMESTHAQHDEHPDTSTTPDPEQGDGPAPGQEQKTGGADLVYPLAGMDFDLAAHPDMKLAADRTDNHFDQLGEENQDTGG